MSYLDDVTRELTAVGIRGRRRSRILTELADHLGCDPDAELGAADALARQFADELGTSLARRAGLISFAALAFAGVLALAAFLASPVALGRAMGSGALELDRAGGGLLAIGGQVAVVAGLLAAIRAWRHRRVAVVSRVEAVIMTRRAGVGVLAGLATMLGFALLALGLQSQVAGWWVTLTLASSGLGAVALAAATPSLLEAVRVRPLAEGTAGDVFDDLGPLVPRPLAGRPWSFALVIAGAVAVVLTAAGVAQADGYDGALRGVSDGLACLAGFGVLGRYLGLR